MWIKLTPDLLRTHLAEPEIQALETAATTSDVENILNEETHNIAESWRGRLRKGHSIDKRTDYVPSELLTFILIHVRFSSYTRLPNMESLLDDLRRDEWRRANEIFDDPFNIDIQDPEEEYIELSSTDPIIEVNPKNYFLDIQ
jgi:hypothetical protein